MPARSPHPLSKRFSNSQPQREGPRKTSFLRKITLRSRTTNSSSRFPPAGFFFNENDVWAHVDAGGSRARIGISDFAQQQLTDISFVGLPTIGAEVDQFGDAGYVESAKATLELVSPVSGRVVAVNSALSDVPETINQDAYGEGWIAELELRDFSADRELLIDGPAYAEIIKKKAAEYS